MGLSSFFLRFLPLVSDEASDFALLMAAFAPLDAISSQGGELYAAWPAARVSRYALCAGGGAQLHSAALRGVSRGSGTRGDSARIKSGPATGRRCCRKERTESKSVLLACCTSSTLVDDGARWARKQVFRSQLRLQEQAQGTPKTLHDSTTADAPDSKHQVSDVNLSRFSSTNTLHTLWLWRALIWIQPIARC